VLAPLAHNGSLLETNDEWAVARRYMSLETLACVTDNPTVRLPAVAT
jgi:putative transposase